MAQAGAAERPGYYLEAQVSLAFSSSAVCVPTLVVVEARVELVDPKTIAPLAAHIPVTECVCGGHLPTVR